MSATEIQATWRESTAMPLFGITVTLLAYAFSQTLNKRIRWLHPLLPTCAILIALLMLADIPYDSYKKGGDAITFFLGPATVALGVPLYKQAQRIRGHVIALLLSISAGSIAGMGTAALFVWMFHGSREVMLSMIPKSVTTPISMSLSEQIHGDPQLTALFTVLAGLVGSVIGPVILQWIGVRDDIAIGAAMGTSAHGIGTARAIRENELQGGVSGLAMALAGIVTSLLTIPLIWWLNAHPR